MRAFREIRRAMRLRSSYRALMRTSDGLLNAAALDVLYDMRRFCHADRSSVKVLNGQIDPLAMAVAEGRREVWLRIQDALKISDRDLESMIVHNEDSDE